MHGKLVNGRLTRPPSQGIIDGKSVSNYNRLPAETLESQGWKPLEINTPDYDEETEYLIPVYDEQANKITVNHTVESITPTIEVITLTADKTQITADGTDACTVTAKFEGQSVDEFTCHLTIDGEVCETVEPIVAGEVVREFTSAEVKVYKIDFHAGDKMNTIFVEAV